MDLSRPVIYRDFDLNTVEMLEGGGKRRGCLLEEADFSTAQGVGYVEKRAQGDGNDASDVFLSARQIHLRGFVYGDSRADTFDRLQDLRSALTPTASYAADPGNRGYLPLAFDVPTNDVAFAAIGNVKQMMMLARPRAQPQFSIRRDMGSGGNSAGGGAIGWTAQLECKDPRIYLRNPVIEPFTVTESGTLTNRGDYPAPVDILIDVAATTPNTAGSVRLQIAGADLTITVPSSNKHRILRYSATLGGILTLEEGSVIDVLRMDLLSADSNANRPFALSGANAYTVTVSGVPLTTNTHLMFNEAYAYVAEFLLPVAKDTSLRNTRPATNKPWVGWKQAPGERHNIGGFSDNKLTEYKSLILWTIDWSQVAEITLAEVWFYTTDDHTGFVTQNGGMKAGRRLNDWATVGGGEGDWSGGVNPNDLYIDTKYLAYAKVPAGAGGKTALPITAIAKTWAPKTVKGGLGLGNYGLLLETSGGQPAIFNNEWVVASSDHPNISLRPILRIVYVPKGTEGLTFGDSPFDDVAPTPALNFIGHYEPGRPGDHLSKVRVKVWPVPSGATPSWDSGELVGGANDTVTNTFSVPAPASLKSLTYYDWQAQCQNQTGGWTPFSTKVQFRKVSNPPALVGPTLPSGTFATLAGVTFQAHYSDPTGNWMDRAQVQVRPSTPVGDPTWDSAPATWDSGLTKVAQDANLYQNRLVRLYQGPGLGPGNYSYRMRAASEFDATSEWLYGTFTLTQGYEPRPGDTNYLTGFDRRKQRFRIRIFGMGTLRAPGKLLAELYDASNVGASEYYNSPGEFFFTLSAIHPQVAVIEPFQTHFSLELYRGEGWKPILNGLMTDFDATEDEVVFYGIDYIGVLAMLSDERFNLAKPELDVDAGGAKYNKDSIRTIVLDQLNRAKAATNSPVGFISVGDVVAMNENILAIFSTFKERLGFISGLIDSHRAGTGARTRLICQRNADSSFMWRIVDGGIDRPNLRMEYGGLIQGFQVIPFGEWGTKVHGIGRTTSGSVPTYAVATAPGVDENVWGAFPRVNVWADIEDNNDLIRRVRQAAAKVGQVGKRMALGIRVDSLDIKDGWDICDSLPVRIQRGVVDTTKYGSGYWTIWGWSWQSYPDGHTDTNLTILPREDGSPISPDLITGKPILANKPHWQVGFGIPGTAPVPPPLPASVQASPSACYVNTSTNITVTLPAPPTPGNYLVFTGMIRGTGSTISAPAGWTLVDKAVTNADNGCVVYQFRRQAQAGDPAVFTFPTSANYRCGCLIETNANTFVNSLVANNQGYPAPGSTATFGPLAGAANTFAVAGFAYAANGLDPTDLSPGAGWTQIAEGTPFATNSYLAEYQMAAGGAVTPTAGLNAVGFDKSWGGIVSTYRRT